MSDTPVPSTSSSLPLPPNNNNTTPTSSSSLRRPHITPTLSPTTPTPTTSNNTPRRSSPPLTTTATTTTTTTTTTTATHMATAHPRRNNTIANLLTPQLNNNNNNNNIPPSSSSIAQAQPQQPPMSRKLPDDQRRTAPLVPHSAAPALGVSRSSSKPRMSRSRSNSAIPPTRHIAMKAIATATVIGGNNSTASASAPSSTGGTAPPSPSNPQQQQQQPVVVPSPTLLRSLSTTHAVAPPPPPPQHLRQSFHHHPQQRSASNSADSYIPPPPPPPPATESLPIAKNIYSSVARSLLSSRDASSLAPPHALTRRDAMELDMGTANLNLGTAPSRFLPQHPHQHQHPHQQQQQQPSTPDLLSMHHQGAGELRLPAAASFQQAAAQQHAQQQHHQQQQQRGGASSGGRSRTTPDAKRAQNRESAKRFRVAQKKRWQELNDALQERDAEIAKLKELLQDVTNSSLNTMRMSTERESQLAAFTASRQQQPQPQSYQQQQQQQSVMSSVDDDDEGHDDSDGHGHDEDDGENENENRDNKATTTTSTTGLKSRSKSHHKQRNTTKVADRISSIELELFTKLLSPRPDTDDDAHDTSYKGSSGNDIVARPYSADIGSLYRVLVARITGAVLGIRHHNVVNGAAQGGDVGGCLWDGIHHTDSAHLKATVVHANQMMRTMKGEPWLFSYRRRRKEVHHTTADQTKTITRSHIGDLGVDATGVGGDGDVKSNSEQCTGIINSNSINNNNNNNNNNATDKSQWIRLKGCMYPVEDENGDITHVVLAEFVEL